jgi:hypothetical protein
MLTEGGEMSIWALASVSVENVESGMTEGERKDEIWARLHTLKRRGWLYSTSAGAASLQC